MLTICSSQKQFMSNHHPCFSGWSPRDAANLYLRTAVVIIKMVLCLSQDHNAPVLIILSIHLILFVFTFVHLHGVVIYNPIIWSHIWVLSMFFAQGFASCNNKFKLRWKTFSLKVRLCVFIDNDLPSVLSVGGDLCVLAIMHIRSIQNLYIFLNQGNFLRRSLFCQPGFETSLESLVLFVTETFSSTFTGGWSLINITNNTFSHHELIQK